MRAHVEPSLVGFAGAIIEEGKRERVGRRDELGSPPMDEVWSWETQGPRRQYWAACLSKVAPSDPRWPQNHTVLNVAAQLRRSLSREFDLRAFAGRG